ncbi:hypothetical protein IW147_001347 [Coemansia sp. RSA 720]|nr:hypothetical protein IW147_001347 [Coemansia sp. RSA 720]KAJ2661252.1 hypothetical protein IW148_003405 [Coemansia sp. RSA 1199]
MVMGKALHLGVDLVLVTTALAGIHRATGYKLNTTHLTDSKTIDGFLDKYLQVGETALDYAALQMRAFPKYFTKD